MASRALTKKSTPAAARRHSEGGPKQTCPECAGAGKLYKLFADLEDVPPIVARLIEQKAYRKISAEIYDEPPEGIPATGKMLRRIGFLGGEIPQVKSLADIPTPEGGSGKMASVKGVEIFAAGTRNGKSYTPQDLDQCCENFKRFSVGDKALLRVPCVPGHEEDLELIERTDLPALGWPNRVWAKETKCPVCGGKGAAAYSEFARAFSRVVVRLVDIRPGRRPGSFHVFSEVTSMTREEMLSQLQAAGMDVSGITDAVPDPVLAEMLRVCQQLKSPAPSADGQMSDGNAPAPQGGAPSVPHNDPRQPSQTVMKYTEEQVRKLIDDTLPKLVNGAVEKLQKPLAEKVASLDKFAEDRIAAEKRASIKSRLDALVQQGKVLPAQREAGLDDVLFAMDAQTVRKFSEKGKDIERTPLDHAFAMLEAGPVLVKFTEKLKAPVSGTGNTSENEDLETVKAHYEKFSEDFRKLGVTEQKYLDRFKRLKERGAMTAAQYVGEKSSN